jgi:hypothetical protein
VGSLSMSMWVRKHSVRQCDGGEEAFLDRDYRSERTSESVPVNCGGEWLRKSFLAKSEPHCLGGLTVPQNP